MRVFRSFGKNPSGKRAEGFTKSSHYKNGIFENLSPTELMVNKPSMIAMTWKFFNKPKNTAPSKPLPSVKTDLKNIRSNDPVIIWFGHSSYLIKMNGKNILVDPVLSGFASPFSFGGRSFKGSDVYSTDDFPDIDILILTHDHYDHLDHRTVIKLKSKIKSVYTSLGVGSHLQSWGFDEKLITELDWWEGRTIGDLELIAAPARHFSGRSLVRNKTLWSSFILKSSTHRIYIGADSGYDYHFKTIGEKYGPFDIAMLETGQYNEQWPLIHMMPEQAVQAAIDLNAKVLLPVHWAKFALAFHPWQEPVQRVLAKACELNACLPAGKVKTTTPMIGEPVILNHSYPDSKWWENID